MTDEEDEPLCWVELARASEAPVGQGILRKHGRLHLLIFHLDADEWTCFDNTCPHAGAPIYPEDFDGECVTCLYHGLRFLGTTGICADAAGWALTRYPIRVEGELVLVGFQKILQS